MAALLSQFFLCALFFSEILHPNWFTYLLLRLSYDLTLLGYNPRLRQVVFGGGDLSGDKET